MFKKPSIGIIFNENSPTSSKELRGEIELRGYEFVKISFDQINCVKAFQEFEDKSLLSYDVLYYRTGLDGVWGRELEKYLTANGRKAVNLNFIDHPYRNSKIQQILTVAKSGMSVPQTVVGPDSDYLTVVKDLGAKFIVKAETGARGEDVHLVTSVSEFNSAVKDNLSKNYCYQEYLPHNHDFRIHMIDGKAVAAYKRIPPVGDFRTNVSRGGSMHIVSSEIKEILYPESEKIAKILGVDIGAVDFLERNTDGRYFFLEANFNPGWEISDKNATGVDMSAMVVDYFERMMEKR